MSAFRSFEKGEIGSVRGRSVKDTARFNAHEGDLTKGKPLIVLKTMGVSVCFGSSRKASFDKGTRRMGILSRSLVSAVRSSSACGLPNGHRCISPTSRLLRRCRGEGVA